jgi:hypothetical protein
MVPGSSFNATAFTWFPQAKYPRIPKPVRNTTKKSIIPTSEIGKLDP